MAKKIFLFENNLTDIVNNENDCLKQTNPDMVIQVSIQKRNAQLEEENQSKENENNGLKTEFVSLQNFNVELKETVAKDFKAMQELENNRNKWKVSFEEILNDENYQNPNREEVNKIRFAFLPNLSNLHRTQDKICLFQTRIEEVNNFDLFF